MTPIFFNQLDQPAQLALVYGQGTYLERHWHATGSVNLYHLPGEGKGFFVEIACLDAPGCPLTWVKAFTTSPRLALYLPALQLAAGIQLSARFAWPA